MSKHRQHSHALLTQDIHDLEMVADQVFSVAENCVRIAQQSVTENPNRMSNHQFLENMLSFRSSMDQYRADCRELVEQHLEHTELDPPNGQRGRRKPC